MIRNNLLELFINNNESNAQLDVFRDNGQVILQIYKYKDVKKWNIGIDFGLHDGYVFELLFTSSKTDNSSNKDRFNSSSRRDTFVKFDKIKEDSYFAFLPADIELNDLSRFINDILLDVYGNQLKYVMEFNVY